MASPPDAVVLNVGHSAASPAPSTPPLHYRSLRPEDERACVALHARLFPIPYEQRFYDAAVNEADDVLSLAAFEEPTGPSSSPSSAHTMVGVVTARAQERCEEEDRDVRRFLRGSAGVRRRLFSATPEPAEPATDDVGPPRKTPFLYILTLGVDVHRRRSGTATTLLWHATRRASRERMCEVAYLHVIAHDGGALRFYRANGFKTLRRLRDFYLLPEGAGPVPGERRYDAYLMARRCVDPIPCEGSSGGRYVEAPLAALASAWDALWRFASRLVSELTKRKEHHIDARGTEAWGTRPGASLG